MLQMRTDFQFLSYYPQFIFLTMSSAPAPKGSDTQQRDWVKNQKLADPEIIVNWDFKRLIQ